MYKVLYIDDEIEHVEDFIEDNENEFEIVTLALKDDFDDMIVEIYEIIKEEKVDILILDHFLKQTNPRINYSGGTLAVEVLNKWTGYPVFLLTAKEDAAFEHEVDPLHIISKELYQTKADNKSINRRINQYVQLYRSRIKSSEERLIELSKIENKSLKEEQEELNLNEFMEKTLDGTNSMPSKLYDKDEVDKLDRLIDLAERILNDKI